MVFEELDLGFSGDGSAETVLVGGGKRGEREGVVGLQRLSCQELQSYLSFGSEERRRQYLLGRVAAKIALKRFIARNFWEYLSCDFDEKDIVISNRENRSPEVDVISETSMCLSKAVGISIAHSGDYAAAVAFFKKTSPWGVDIEVINPLKVRPLQRVLLDMEPVPKEEVEGLTVFWCLKEALGKALLCGFGRPFENFRIKECYYENGVYSVRYEYFSDYRGKAGLVLNGSVKLVAAIAFPAA